MSQYGGTLLSNVSLEDNEKRAEPNFDTAPSDVTSRKETTSAWDVNINDHASHFRKTPSWDSLSTLKCGE